MDFCWLNFVYCTAPPRRLCSLYFVFVQSYFVFFFTLASHMMSAFSTLPTSLFGPNFRGNQPCHLTSLERCHLGLHPDKLYPFLYHSPGSLSNTYCPHLAPSDFLNGRFCFGNGCLLNSPLTYLGWMLQVVCCLCFVLSGKLKSAAKPAVMLCWCWLDYYMFN